MDSSMSSLSYSHRPQAELHTALIHGITVLQQSMKNLKSMDLWLQHQCGSHNLLMPFMVWYILGMLIALRSSL